MASFDSILSCARDNDAEAIMRLLRQGCPPSYANRMGQSALHIGALWGSVDAVKVLIEGGANIMAKNQMLGSTPLHCAAKGRGPVARRAECAKILIAARADVQMKDMSGETPLDSADDEAIRVAMGAAPLLVHHAVQARGLQQLVDAVNKVKTGNAQGVTLEMTNPNGETALHLAALLSWHDGIKHLLASKADASTQNHCGRSPLHDAAIQGNLQTVQMLLAVSASANVQDEDMERTREAPTEDGHRTPLHYAAELGNVLVMSALLEGRANPNAADTKKQTPLHLAMTLRESDLDVEEGCGIKIINLEKKPQWNGRLGGVMGSKVVKGGGTEVRWPVQVNGEDSACVLLKEQNLQRLPDETLRLLLEARADVNLGNVFIGPERTLLHEAARCGDTVLAEHLLCARACVDKADSKLGLSALHLAARGKHHGIVRLLLEARADRHKLTNGGKTALELAETNGAQRATLALLKGEEFQEAPQTLKDLTPEQRALLFID